MELAKKIIRNIVNIPGWHTRRKIVVLESDDWGSIRMPSPEVYSRFMNRGFNVSGADYNRLDTLESNEDLALLYEVLQTYKNADGIPPVITANFVVGNPDFKKIRDSDFTEYYYEPVTETLKRYPRHDMVETLWKEGMSAGIFLPQFHGREHVNIVRWMDALRKKTSEIMFTFDNETTFSGEGDYNFMEVLDYNSPEDMIKMKESIVEGLNLFKDIFGFNSKTFIPPCYAWNSEIEEALYLMGVMYIQGLFVQSVPTGSFGIYKKKYHFLGDRNKFGQYFLIRNCFFEPSIARIADPVGECLNRISIAFRWNKPAVISMHRINFMGSLVEKNRSDNLLLFRDLLKRIITYWPEVEFMTSDRLGELIAKDA